METLGDGKARYGAAFGKTPVVRIVVLAAGLAASATAAAYPRLPEGFEARYTVEIFVDNGLGKPLAGGYHERFQEVRGRTYVFRDRYEGNLKPANHTFEMGGTPQDVLASVDTPVPGHFQRYIRSASGMTYGLLEPAYRLLGKDTSEAIPKGALQNGKVSFEISGDRYTGAIDPESGLLRELTVSLASGGSKSWRLSDIRRIEGTPVPGKVVYDELLGNPATVISRYEYGLDGFKKLDRLDHDLRVDTLAVGSRVKDEVAGSVYEVTGPGKRRNLGAVPKMQTSQVSRETENKALLFVGLVASAMAVLGFGGSKAKRERPPRD